MRIATGDFRGVDQTAGKIELAFAVAAPTDGMARVGRVRRGDGRQHGQLHGLIQRGVKDFGCIERTLGVRATDSEHFAAKQLRHAKSGARLPHPHFARDAGNRGDSSGERVGGGIIELGGIHCQTGGIRTASDENAAIVQEYRTVIVARSGQCGTGGPSACGTARAGEYFRGADYTAFIDAANDEHLAICQLCCGEAAPRCAHGGCGSPGVIP